MLRLLDRLFGRKQKQKDQGVTVHFTGHRILADAKKSRFPVAREEEVAELVGAILKREKVTRGYGGLASGSDIIIAEALRAMGAEVHVILPGPVTFYVETSVAEAGPDWVRRFHEAFNHATSTRVLEAGDGADAFGKASDIAMDQVETLAQAGGGDFFQLALFDGKATEGPAGASADIERGRSKGWRQIIIRLKRRGRIKEQ